MLKNVVIAAFVVLFLIMIFLGSNLKDSYKVLEVNKNEKMDIPPFADWREFEDQSKRFQVTLPAPPQFVKESVSIPHTADQKRLYEIFVSQQLSGPLFTISIITYPKDFDTSDKKQLLQETLDETMAAKPDNKLKEKNDVTFQGYPAIDFEFTNPKFNFKGKAFIVNKSIFLLMYVANSKDFNLKEYEHFISTFKMPPNNTSTTKKFPNPNL